MSVDLEHWDVKKKKTNKKRTFCEEIHYPAYPI